MHDELLLFIYGELLGDRYTSEEIKSILKALRQNASLWPADSPQWSRYMNTQLQILRDRYKAIVPDQYNVLTQELSYTDAEIRQALFANQVSLNQLIQNTKWTQRQAELLRENGYTNTQIHQMLMGGFTVQNMQQIAVDRVLRAKKYETDKNGLTTNQIHDLLFRGRDIYGQATSGLVSALLSGDDAKIREGSVARCVLDWVTVFDQVIGPRGSTTQIDVGTQHHIIEAKVDRVTAKCLGQVKTLLATNPGKGVLLYAPGYQQSATQAIVTATQGRASVVRSCADLRNTITARGGP